MLSTPLNRLGKRELDLVDGLWEALGKWQSESWVVKEVLASAKEI